MATALDSTPTTEPDVRRLSGSLGAEVRGLRLTEVDEHQVASILDRFTA